MYFLTRMGILLIVPNRHVAKIGALRDCEKLDLFSLYEEVLGALKKALRPHGFNVGMNLGQIAGAGIPHHLHLHVVPRWKGDVNFMPVIGGSKVISESLDSVYDALRRIIVPTKSKRKNR